MTYLCQQLAVLKADEQARSALATASIHSRMLDCHCLLLRQRDAAWQGLQAILCSAVLAQVNEQCCWRLLSPKRGL